MANSKKESRKSIKLRSDYVVDGGGTPKSLSHSKKGFELVAVKFVNAAALRTSTYINTENFRNKNKLFAITDALFAHEIYYFLLFYVCSEKLKCKHHSEGGFC